MWEAELKIAKRAAICAGEYLKKEQNVRVDSDEGKDIKVSSDKKSEEIIMDILSESGISIFSEESGFIGRDSDCFWVVDPLDGTMNYLRGIKDLAAVSIALWNDGEPILGVINRFNCGELFYGDDELGAYLNDYKIETSQTKTIKQAILATGFPVNYSYATDNLTQFIKRSQQFKKVRMFGAASIMGAFVSCGRLDVYTEEGIMLWDIAASTAIVRAAGGYTQIKMLNSEQCVCNLFANECLYEAYSNMEGE